MTQFPQDGSTFLTESIDRIAYRWTKYKPDGARQMGKPGRWQKQVWSGDYFKWENCEEPEGEICEPIGDGPISAAFKAHDRLQARVAELENALTAAANQLTRAHEDAFKQCAGYGLVTSDGREFSCFELNQCGSVSSEARTVLARETDDA